MNFRIYVRAGVYILPKNLISCHRTIFSSEFKPRISEIKNQSDLPQKWKTLLICATKISNFQKMQEMCKISEKCFYLCMFHHSYCHIDTYFKMTFWFPVVRTARKFELSPHLQDLVNSCHRKNEGMREDYIPLDKLEVENLKIATSFSLLDELETMNSK